MLFKYLLMMAGIVFARLYNRSCSRYFWYEEKLPEDLAEILEDYKSGKNK